MSLAALFAPRSVAVLGVSRNPAKLGYRLLENITAEGYPGPLYAVNPAGEAILGRETLPDIESLPEGIDLALLSLPAPAVADALKRLGQRRVRAAVVLSSGFGEVDERGRASERDLVGIIGSRSRVWEVMNGRRPLTLPMIRALHRELGIPLESLISEAP